MRGGERRSSALTRAVAASAAVCAPVSISSRPQYRLDSLAAWASSCARGVGVSAVSSLASRAVSRQVGGRRSPGGRGKQRTCDGHGNDSTPAACSAAKPASGGSEPALGGVPAAHRLTSPSAGTASTRVMGRISGSCELRRTIAARSRHVLAVPPIPLTAGHPAVALTIVAVA